MNQGENLAQKLYKNKKVLLLLGVVALAVVGGALYIKLSQPKVTGTDTTTQTHSTTTKQYAPTSGGGNSSNSSGKGSAATTSGSTSGSLPAPAGQLLNKQTVSLTSSAPQTDPSLESVCQTISQASCDIRLTGPNGQVKTVGAQSTGTNGTVIFDWNARTLGLTPGKWTVQAVVVQNNLIGTSHTEYLEVQS